MRTIIAGSRDFDDYDLLLTLMNELPWEVSAILSGTAKGADRLGEKYAWQMNVPLEKYPAEWDKYGKTAGFERNRIMATKADALVAFWDGKSNGTANMIQYAINKRLKLIVWNFSVKELSNDM